MVQKTIWTCKTVTGIVQITLGIVILVFGMFYGLYIPGYLNDKFTIAGKGACKQEDLDDKSFLEPYSDCADCTPYYASYYGFNVSNANEYLGDPVNVKPRLVEMGPFVYMKNPIKVDAKLDGDFVTYKSYNKWSFQGSMSAAVPDRIVKMDPGYLAITTATGGELNFVDKIMTSLFGLQRGVRSFNMSIMPVSTKRNFMKLLNGINSFNPKIMAKCVRELKPLFNSTTNVIKYIAELATKKYDGFYYNGLLVERTLNEWFFGHPSFTFGVAIGSQYPACSTPLSPNNFTMLHICDTCKGATCHRYWSKCKTCRKAREIRATSDALCDALEVKLKAALGEEEAARVVGGTCRQCQAKSMFCLAQLPGDMEGSGLDYTQVEVNTDTLPVYMQNQGCSDITKRGEYQIYANDAAVALWNKYSKEKSFPTIFDLLSFRNSNWCDSDVKNGVVCAAFEGGDATVFPAGGVSISGLAAELPSSEYNVYVSQAKQNVTLVTTHGFVETEDIELKRFRPPNNALAYTSWNKNKGIGYPTGGVACLAYVTGFLSFLSRPMFLFADKSLFDNVQLFDSEGKEVTKNTQESSLTHKYDTYVDVEPASGMVMNSRKRLMASFALSTEAVRGSTRSTSNLVLTGVKSEVLIPSFWADEKATITTSLADSFKKAKALSKSTLPVLVIGVTLGVVIIVVGATLILTETGSNYGQ